ncbi:MULTISPECIES: metal-dependent hydrolase [unclassified Nitratiruptor]|uniref:metal-dependent hydrolase n=1 Tax=unclassified Nitratiruptor TaxID=2624044 RepID=UPI001915C5B1|nr:MULTISPECIES: metal-dependent hydrolase [unclassified Nitratiruptor]
MTYKTHIAFAESVAVPPILVLYTQNAISYFDLQNFIIAVAVAALLPDLDHLHSYISKKIPILPFIITLFAKHRGFTHSLKGIISVYILTMLAFIPHIIPLSIAAGIMIGYPLHILGDAMTTRGISNFCCGKKLLILPKPLRFSTGSFKEHLYFLFFSGLIGLEIWLINPSLL